MKQQDKIVPLRTSYTIDEEAAVWLVRLDNGNLSKQDKNDLKAWLAIDKRHQVALQAMADTWDDMDEVLNIVNSKSASEKLSILPILTPILKPLAVAASVSFIAVFMWLNSPEQVQRYSYSTAIGQQLDTRFIDGSVIHLNTNSHVEAEFTTGKRIIKLIKGEALFDVAHDPQRPFIVYAGNRLVQAVGTKFVVQIDSENIEITVTEGKVKLSQVNTGASLDNIRALDSKMINKGDVFIAKGEQAIAEQNHAPKLVHLQDSYIQRELSWLDGKLVFENENLADIVEEINRYSDINILLKDEELSRLKISGRFDLDDSRALIEAIELAFNLTSQQIDSNSVLLSKK